MELNKFFKVSAITAAFALAGCGGDINITEGSISTDNSVSNSNNTTNNNTGGGDNTGGDNTGGDNTPTFPGTINATLTQAVTAALGQSVTVQTITGVITEDTTLVAGAMYALEGPVFVGNDKADSATLTIEPGVVVFGQTGNDYLVVSRDSQISVNGTASEPVIMTSLQDVVGQETTAGQWGGLVLLGNAPSNKCPTDSDCALQVEGVQEGAVFGGTDETDSSGNLNYVVVKFAGFEIAPDNELNGVTFGGVGSGTTVDYLQVHANADDGVEFFGGNVEVKHLVLTGNQDDSVDWDNGYRGKMQWVYIEHDKNSGDANRGIEADNDGSTPDKEPQSNPMISNLTVIGNNFDGDDDSEGVYLREGTGAQIFNMVVTGPTEMGECLEVENVDESQANLADGTITIQNSVMACTNGENFKNADGAVDLEDWFLNTQTGNSVSESVMLASDGSPMAGSPLLGAGMDASTVDGFFTATDYIGAVGSNDWRQGWAFGFGGGVVTAEAPVVGCPTGTTAISPVGGKTTCQISGVITSDVTLTNNNNYALSGPVFVGNDNADSATLSIEAGTTIFGRTGNDYLVVSRGSQIDAQGTASAPITMTSAQDVNGENTADGVYAGQWGGLVLLGNAPSNKCPTDSDCALQVEGVQEGAVFGGTDSEDNSGTLRYVVVKHAGFEIAPDNELNGVTFGGVGSNTTVEYLQVHQNADDGVEFFGGSVNVKYLVLTGNQDDSIDWDNGYQGKIQHVVIQHATDDSDANRAFEADNDGSTPDKEPQSNPTVANVTIIGNNFDGDDDSEGVYLREGTGAQLSNFVITGPAGMGECFEVEDVAESQANLADGTITFTNSVIACENGENFKNADGATDLENWFLNVQEGNAVAADRATVVDGIFTIYTGVTPKDFSGDTFFDNVDYVGGVSATNNWTAGWTVGLE